MTRGFQRITFFSPLSLKLIAYVFIQWQFWTVKCCFVISVHIWRMHFYSSLQNNTSHYFHNHKKKNIEKQYQWKSWFGMIKKLRWWKRRISSQEFDHVRIEWSFVPLPRTQPDYGGRQITRTTSPLKTLQIVQQQEFGNINILQSGDYLVPPVNCSKQTSQLRLEDMILPSLLFP